MQHIKKIYLYAVSLISLIIVVVAGIMLINMALKALIFKKADQGIYYGPQIACDMPAAAPSGDASNYKVPPECNDPDYAKKQEQQENEARSAQRQRDASQSLAMIIVAAPIFLYHWRLARKES